MGANFSRLKVWAKTKLKYSDLNAEFNNILNNFTPTGLDDYSASLSEMRTTVDPAPAGVESLATSSAGEFARLRYMIKRLVGGTHWYSDPGRVLGANPTELMTYLPFEGSTAEEAFSDTIARGALLNAVSRTSADVQASDFGSTNVKFGSYSYSLKTTSALAVAGKLENYGTFSAHFRNLSAGDYVAYNPLLGIEVYLNGSGYLTAKVTEATASSESAKATTTVAGTSSRSGVTSFKHVGLRWRLNNHAGAATDMLELDLDGADEGTQVASDNILMNAGSGGTWFFGARRQDPTWTKFSAMSVNPRSEATSAWGGGTTGTTVETISNGVLTIASTVGSANFFRNDVNMSTFTAETKFKLDSVVTLASDRFTLFSLEDLTLGRACSVSIGDDGVTISDAALFSRTFVINPYEWHTYRLTCSGSPNPTVKFYIDGVCVLEGQSFDTASSIYGFTTLQWGTAGTISGTGKFEYMSYSATAATAPVSKPPASAGELDDLALIKSVVSDTAIVGLSSNSAKSVFGADPKPGPAFPILRYLNGNRTSLGVIPQSVNYFFSDGKTETAILVNLSHNASTTPGPDFYQVTLEVDDVIQVSRNAVLQTQVTNETTILRRKIYPVGLHKLDMKFVLGAGTFPTDIFAYVGQVTFVKEAR